MLDPIASLFFTSISSSFYLLLYSSSFHTFFSNITVPLSSPPVSISSSLCIFSLSSWLLLSNDLFFALLQVLLPPFYLNCWTWLWFKIIRNNRSCLFRSPNFSLFRIWKIVLIFGSRWSVVTQWLAKLEKLQYLLFVWTLWKNILTEDEETFNSIFLGLLTEAALAVAWRTENLIEINLLFILISKAAGRHTFLSYPLLELFCPSVATALSVVSFQVAWGTRNSELAHRRGACLIYNFVWAVWSSHKCSI